MTYGEVAEIDIDETKNATVEVSITNSYSGTISDILIAGKYHFRDILVAKNENINFTI